ncbi:hypothetical protein NQZ68_023089 [Dissostichus eleginoides]|nr:hypothetical protein NQZ68_023089 [Dissostichus eleginoides]
MDLIICVLGLLALAVDGIRCQGVYGNLEVHISDLSVLTAALSIAEVVQGECEVKLRGDCSITRPLLISALLSRAPIVQLLLFCRSK